MVYIKKLVMKGFKSFARETEIPFLNSMNVIVGPNGSGKSNIVDGLCFVLGRLSIKSIRAAKSAHLIFAGTKQYKPSSEASVKLILDNSDKKFSLDDKEITIERIVRHNGQSIYKINNEVKTRQEVLELLAQSGIDPYGFNIILQGEIDSIIRMNPEERRKVIEEVAGISIYEVRKEKSLHELEKTDEKLKEVTSILRERNSYLHNLEEERKQALKFKKLEEQEKICKASIIKRKLTDKEKQILTIEQKKGEKEKEKSQYKEKELNILKKIEILQEEISGINLQIQKSSGIEQEQLNKEISDIRAELAGLNVRKENNDERLQELLSRKQKVEEEIKNLQGTIEKLRKEFPLTKKAEELDKKKSEMEKIELERKKFYNLKERLNSLKEKIEDKELSLQKNNNESLFLLKEIEKISYELKYKDADSCRKNLDNFNKDLEISALKLANLEKNTLEEQKLISILLSETSKLEEIKKQVSKIDICPLCKSKITEEHIKHVFLDCDEKISKASREMGEKKSLLEEYEKETASLKEKTKILQNNLQKAEINLVKLENAEERNQQIKRLGKEIEAEKQELVILEKELKNTEKNFLQLKDSEEKYDKIFLEIQEISSRTKENISTESEFKEKQLESLKLAVKQILREDETLKEELEEIEKQIQEKESLLEKREQESSLLEKKFQNLIAKRTEKEKQIHESNTFVFEERNKINLVDNDINNIKVEKARLDAEKENLLIDFESYKEIKIISLPLHIMQEKLEKTKIELQSIGSVNLRALEVYDKIKEEYDSIAEKVSVLEKEKLEIMKIIEEIDKKKRKTFMKTLTDINELFNRNFMQLSIKGQVFLELENPEEPFSAGLDIVIKVAKGKYFDITSLSGGEQTLVALSLIFAIQEYKPYSFYIFDEVDAALDKRNSEKLAILIKKYMKTGQYIIITHNDAIITESAILYGISMQEGVSKILSLEI